MKFYNKSTFANEMIIHDKHFEESYIVLHQQVLYSDLQKWVEISDFMCGFYISYGPDQ